MPIGEWSYTEALELSVNADGYSEAGLGQSSSSFQDVAVNVGASCDAMLTLGASCQLATVAFMSTIAFPWAPVSSATQPSAVAATIAGEAKAQCSASSSLIDSQITISGFSVWGIDGSHVCWTEPYWGSGPSLYASAHASLGSAAFTEDYGLVFDGCSSAELSEFSASKPWNQHCPTEQQNIRDTHPQNGMHKGFIRGKRWLYNTWR